MSPFDYIPRSGKAFDEPAEELVADEYGLEGLALDSEWLDLRHSTARRSRKSIYVDEDRREGLRRQSLSRLGGTDPLAHRQRRTGDHMYAFVLFDGGNGVLRIQRMKPSTVLSLVNERGGWNRSGHQSMGRQHKIPRTEIF